MPSEKLSIEEIIRRDVEKNNSDITFEEGMAIFNKFVGNKLKIFRVNNTLFLIMKDVGDTIYYHSINADSLKPFLKNCLKFFSVMSKAGKKTAITYFDSEKLLEILERFKLPGEVIQKSDNPQKGTYMLTTDLNIGSK
jgi:hypothetical protein